MTITPKRYHSTAIILHWVMAVCFILMLISGIVMTEENILPKSQIFTLYQWHKGLGVILFVAFFFRVAMRLIFQAPSLPPMQKTEKILAKLGHAGLYALMLFIPLSGWVMVSASVYGLPTIVFNMFEWPHIPNIQGNETIEHWSNKTHEILTTILMIMIALHIGAVIKHYVHDKINLLPRMWWRKEK